MKKENELSIGDYVVGRNSVNYTKGVIVATHRSTGTRKDMLYTVRDFHPGGPDISYFANQIRKRKPLRSGCWYGEDAWILNGNRNEGYTILVGGHSLLQALYAQHLVEFGLPLRDFEDYVVFAEPDEWKEQNP